VRLATFSGSLWIVYAKSLEFLCCRQRNRTIFTS